MLRSRRYKRSKQDGFSFTRSQLLTFIKRVRVIQLHKLGFSLSRISEEMEVSEPFVSKHRHKEFVIDDLIDRSRSGAPVRITQKQKIKIIEKAQDIDFSPRKLAMVQNNPSRTSIRRVIKASGLYPYKKKKACGLQDHHMAARVAWCSKMKKKNLSWFERLIVIDSKIFTVDGGYNPQNQRYYCYSPEEVPIHSVEKGKMGIHVYGGMSARGLLKLIFIKGRVTSERYREEVLINFKKDIESRQKITWKCLTSKIS